MTRTRRYHLLIVLALAALVVGCGSVDDNMPETDYVVVSVLVAGDGLPQLWLSRGDYPGESFPSKGEPGAQVMVRVVGPQAEEEIHYEESEGTLIGPGFYQPTSDHRVLPLHRYDLTIQPATTTGPITATTLVPDTFTVDFDQGSEVVYQADGQLDLPISRHAYPGREKSYYIFDTGAWEPSEENLVPSAQVLYDNGSSFRELSRTSSSIIELDSNHQGPLTLEYPMSGINFYGSNMIIVRALDDNVYHYSRSQVGATFVWSEFSSSHINGARGLFGSEAVVSVYIRVVE